MTVKVLLFGPYADVAANSSVEVQLPDGIEPTAGHVRACLAEQHPRLRDLLPTALLAVNCQYARPESVVRADDELAVIGLVAGG